MSDAPVPGRVEHPAGAVRVVSYNVRDLLDDRDEVAHVLRTLAPDVVCLQEVPRRWFQIPRVRRLARESALRWIDGGRGSGGTAVMVGRRLDVLSHASWRLPVAHRWTRTRGAAQVTVRVPGGDLLTVASVHLSLQAAERLRHLDEIVGRATVAPGVKVLAGDLNEEPDGPVWDALLRSADGLAAGLRLRDAALADPLVLPAPTFPARRPHRRIDAVLVGEGVVVRRARVAGVADRLTAEGLAAASDHLPLVADLVVVGAEPRDPAS